MVLFLGLMLVYYAPDPTGGRRDRGIHAMLVGYARASAWVLRVIGIPAQTMDRQIGGPVALSVDRECDAFQSIALFAAAVIAFPARWGRRVLGLTLGLLLLGAANVIRIVALYLTLLHAPTWFEFAHYQIGQLALIAATITLFLIWVRWSLNKGAACLTSEKV